MGYHLWARATGMMEWIKWGSMEKEKVYGWAFFLYDILMKFSELAGMNMIAVSRINVVQKQNALEAISKKMHGMENGIVALISMMERR